MSDEAEYEGEALGDALRDLTERFESSNPMFKEILLKARRGEIGEVEAMQTLMREIASNPDLGNALTKAAEDALAPLREQDNSAAGPGIFQPPSGLPRLDPLWEADLHERIQFDGDAPELRRGPAPPGVEPAVPVSSFARTPVAIGAALEKASAKVAEQVKQLEADFAQDCGDFNNVPAPIANGHFPIQPDGYKAGEVPALQKTVPLSGSELSDLSAERKMELSWKSFSTTQGRMSMSPHISEIIEGKLKEGGIDVSTADFNAAVDPDKVVAKAHWTLDVAGSGPGSTNEMFDTLQVAAASLASELGQAELKEGEGPYILELATVNAYGERKVGWAALLRRV
jgi:hypothetical protein